MQHHPTTPLQRVVLFGATGLTGSHVLEELLAAGYHVTAVSRNATTIDLEHPNLNKVSGDVHDAHFVAQVITGAEAVVSTISEGVEIQRHTQSEGNKSIIQAMQDKQLQRLICMGAFGILDGPDGKLLRDQPGYPELYLPISYEQSRVNEALNASGLLWTQVCPPMILAEKADGHYVVHADRPPAGKQEVNAGNIGHFIAAALRTDSFLRKRVGIANAL